MKKYAVITGASSGIGAAFARNLARQGYPLILIARRKKRLENLARKLPTECEIIAADLTSLETCRQIWQQLADKNIEIFINNAGLGDCGPFLTGSPDKEMQMLDLNVRAVHFFTKCILQKMQKSDHGYLLNVASSAGLLPAGPYMAVYYATKSYVGCLCPGPVDTEFNQIANVQFRLKGIQPGFCVDYAFKQMKKRKVIIIPAMHIKAVVILGRFLPQNFYIRLVSHQQKKKIYP